MIAASHPSIQVDQLTGLLLWDQPIGTVLHKIVYQLSYALGSDQAHWVDYKVEKENCTEYIHSNIYVPIVYQPFLTSLTKHKLSNLHRVAGYIKFNGTAKETAQNNLPVILKIVEGEQLIEQIEIESKRRFFAYDVYPYTGSRRDYFIVSLL